MTARAFSTSKVIRKLLSYFFYNYYRIFFYKNQEKTGPILKISPVKYLFFLYVVILLTRRPTFRPILSIKVPLYIFFFLLLFSHKNKQIIFAVLWIRLAVICHYISPTKDSPEKEGGTKAASYSSDYPHTFASCSFTHSLLIVSFFIAALNSSLLAGRVCSLLLMNLLLI